MWSISQPASLRAESFLTVSAVEGSGSGSVIDKLGHILTNYHVVEGARNVNVTLFNGEAYPAELVGQDPDNDIAVLKITAPDDQLFPIPIGDSSRLRVGQRILAIGNPFGLERTMSDGIISSLNRQLPTRNRRTMKSIIQIDAALNQGNSGGPLLNTRGELIGMNTAIATSTGDNAGIGFSIPANTIRRVIPQLIENGRVIRPTIGITRVFETEEGIGIVVVDVTPGGPADQAGIQASRLSNGKIADAACCSNKSRSIAATPTLSSAPTIYASTKPMIYSLSSNPRKSGIASIWLSRGTANRSRSLSPSAPPIDIRRLTYAD